MKMPRLAKTAWMIRGLTLALAFGALNLSACSKENSEDQSIAAGLSCLDTATTSSDADVCQTKVAGLQTAQASLIRCSANLIAQGFTGSRIATAFQQMKNSGTGTANATSSMLSYFVFAKTLPNDTAALTYANCSASGVSSMIAIGNLVQMTSLLVPSGSLDGSTYDPSSPTFDPAALQTAINTLYTSNNTATNAQIGTLATSTQSNYCAAGSALSTQDVCTKLNSAISSGSGDPANIGRALLNLLKQ